MADRNAGNLIIEDARIMFRNFAGKEKKFNAAGDRNFSVAIDDDLAKVLERDGWNIKYTKPREDDEDPRPQAHIAVKVKFDGARPPKIVMITSRGKTFLDEETAELLDWADITIADVVIRPYDWNVNGNTGRKAYLSSIYATIYEDEIDLKYAHLDKITDTPNIEQ